MDSENITLTRSKNSYVATAIVWLNTSLLLLFLIGACYLYSWIRPTGAAAAQRPYQDVARTKALHTLSPPAARQCFRDTEKLMSNMEYLYYSWVGFSERPFQSTCLNIDQADPLPLRRTISDSKGAKKTIWLFGGSTQFGFGAPDNQTIASNLSRILSERGFHYNVVNHGHTWYYSTQEAALFANLLRHGQKCDVAVFLDGLNDNVTWGDIPHFADRTARAFIKEERDAETRSQRQIIITPAFPPVRVLDALLRHRPPAEGADVTLEDYNPVDIYQFNFAEIERMAEAANVKMAAYWQPTPFDYIAGAQQRRKGFPITERIPNSNGLVRQIKSKNFHFIADLFQHDDFEDIYLDSTHYGDKGNRMVAEAIAASLRDEGLLQGD